jgi:hypothetical protein
MMSRVSNYRDETIAFALRQISARNYVLPAIQREFVWSTDDICRLFDSILRGYPISSLLFWQVEAANANRYRFYDFVLNYHELDAPGCPAHHNLPVQDRIAILDGQQRLTALNIGLRGSHAARARYQRRGRPSSYPRRTLHLDLCAEPRQADDRAEDLAYRLAFLTPEDAAAQESPDGEVRWYPVSEVMGIAEEDFAVRLNETLIDLGIPGHRVALNALNRLWQAVHAKPHVSYFLETAQDLDRVLNIFIRVNREGESLSKSDLLMSIATAQWRRDARQEIPATVRRINEVAPGFAFTRDNVLKAGLVLAGISDIGFTARTFDRENMSRLEAAWDEVTDTLYRAVELLASFGLSRSSISANMVLIPVAHYLHRRGLTDRYLTSTADREDRERVRDWVVRSLLRPGVWGSGLDTLLGRVRRAIDEAGAQEFPSARVETEMAALGKSLVFDEGLVEALADVAYGDQATVPLLSILFGHVDTGQPFHVDHVFPRARLTARRLLDAGVGELDAERIARVERDRLANLQLLAGPENIGKSDQLPLAWAAERYRGDDALATYLERNDLVGLPEDIEAFPTFYAARRERLVARLTSVLGRAPGSLAVPTPGAQAA